MNGTSYVVPLPDQTASNLNEIAVAEYNRRTSKFGYHIIKRVE